MDTAQGLGGRAGRAAPRRALGTKLGGTDPQQPALGGARAPSPCPGPGAHAWPPARPPSRRHERWFRKKRTGQLSTGPGTEAGQLPRAHGRARCVWLWRRHMDPQNHKTRGCAWGVNSGNWAPRPIPREAAWPSLGSSGCHAHPFSTTVHRLGICLSPESSHG